MDWTRPLAYIPGTVDQELLLRLFHKEKPRGHEPHLVASGESIFIESARDHRQDRAVQCKLATLRFGNWSDGMADPPTVH